MHAHGGKEISYQFGDRTPVLGFAWYNRTIEVPVVIVILIFQARERADRPGVISSGDGVAYPVSLASHS
jgi:hypothetical protein